MTNPTIRDPLELFRHNVRIQVRMHGLAEDYEGVQRLLQEAMRFANLSEEVRVRYLQALDPTQWVDLLPDGRVRLHAQAHPYRMLTDADLIRHFVAPDAIILNLVGAHFCRSGRRKLVVATARLGQNLLVDSARPNLEKAAAIIRGVTDRQIEWLHLVGRQLVILAQPTPDSDWLLRMDHPGAPV